MYLLPFFLFVFVKFVELNAIFFLCLSICQFAIPVKINCPSYMIRFSKSVFARCRPILCVFLSVSPPTSAGAEEQIEVLKDD